jgi:hypothetical protein
MQFTNCPVALSLEEEALADNSRQFLRCARIVSEVPLTFRLLQRADDVVKVIRPDGVEAKAARVSLPHIARIVLVRLGDQDGARGRAPARGERIGNVRQDMARRGINDGKRRVKAKPVNVVLMHPVRQILQDKAAYF